MSESDLCQRFCILTGASSVEALNWLEMAGFALEDAVELFFNAGDGGHSSNASGTSNNKSTHEDHFASGRGFNDVEEVRVRMPDEVKRQKLVDTSSYLGTKHSTCRMYTIHM